MLLKFLLFFISFNLFSASLDFQYKLRSFKVNYDVNQISFKDSSTTLNLKNKKCIQDSFLALKNNLDNYLKKEFRGTKEDFLMKIVFDKNILYENEESKRLKYFLDIPNEIKKIKLEEEFGCN